MSRKYIPQIPKKPFLRRKTYDIPETYLEAYRKAGVTGRDEQVMLFHITQFGGFRLKKIPRDMNLDESFVNKWLKQKSENGYRSFRANPGFIERFGHLQLKPLEKKWSCDCLNEEEMKECGFSDKEIADACDFLSELNKFYSSLRLDISMPYTGLTAEDRIRLSRFHAIPFLVKKPKTGGRFFQPGPSYQRINSVFRQMMTINSEQTSEIDLAAATIQFLNIALISHSLDSLEGSVLSHEDPYDYFLSTLNSPYFLDQFDEEPTGRETLKDLLYTAIYSTKTRQKSNVNRKLRLMEKRYRHNALVSNFPEFFTALSELRSAAGLPLHMVINREESKYAQEILQTGCLERRLPILPLHDSFITTASNHDQLEEIMDTVSESMYGKKLSHKRKY